MSPIRLLFAGTPAFAVPCLDALAERTPHRLLAVYTQPDRPAGRGRKPKPSPVSVRARALGIPVRQPQSLRDPREIEAFRAWQPDLFVVVAYGLLLPPDILAIPRLGCINVHASLLPRWRGAAPIQRAILAGDRETGISIMRMEAGLDTGPVYSQKAVPIEARETGGQLHDRLARLGAEALLETLPALLAGTLSPRPQDETQVTYARKITKGEAEIDWRRSAQAIDRQIRAFNPWPVAQTRLETETLRLWAGEVVSTAAVSEPPGRVLAADRAGIRVATGAGILNITRLQVPGKRPISADAFRNAHPIEGKMLG